MGEKLKQEAAERAVEDVKPGMRLGLGTGSTADFFVRALGARVRAGMDVIGVPTSERTRALAESEGIELATLDTLAELDLTVDGADEIDSQLSLIKGGGGALLREKIVAAASREMIVIADATKKVATLGQFPLPIEVVPFGLCATRHAIRSGLRSLGFPDALDLRGGDEHPFVTDGGHYILDARLGAIENPRQLADMLVAVPGVVEHGLFIGLAKKAYVAGPGGVEILQGT